MRCVAGGREGEARRGEEGAACPPLAAAPCRSDAPCLLARWDWSGRGRARPRQGRGAKATHPVRGRPCQR